MSRIFRSRPAAFIVTLFALVYLQEVVAAPLIPKVSDLSSHKDFLFGIREVRQNIENVQCGGWEDTGAGIGGGSIPVADIRGVPGRTFDPLGNPPTGLGLRENFEYPDEPTTTGFKTACDVTDDQIINPEKWCLIDENTATPEQCRKLYERLTVTLPQMVADGTFSSNNPNVTCQTVTPRPPPLGPLVARHYCFTYTSECTGEECRTPNPPRFQCASPSPTPITYQSSFYRNYKTHVEAPNGQAWDFDTECYERYKEDDPRNTVTSRNDERCEISVSTDDNITPNELPGWNDTENRKQKGTVAASTGATTEPPTEPRRTPDPWKADSQTNLTIPDYATWAEEQEERGATPKLSDLLSMAIESKATASRTSPPHSKTDAFDDTAERDFGSFWEREQQELLRITRDPQVTVVLPALFLHNLSEDDPIFSVLGEETQTPSGLVHVTLRAGLDDLGLVLESLAEQQVLRIDEVNIPVLVPVAGEIDARIAAWQQWQEREAIDASVKGRESFAGEAEANIERMKQYKERIEQVRTLRNAILFSTQRVLEKDRDIRQRMADWYRQNAERIKQIVESPATEQRREVQRIWKLIQRSLLLADECQLAWCSNQRYTAPVYSLLDSWWGDRSAGQPRNFDYVPTSITELAIPATEDLLFDFSSFSFSGTTLRIPVYHPVQVRIELPLPPLLGEKPTSGWDYPELPPIPADTDLLGAPLPDIDWDDLPEIDTSSAGPIAKMETAKSILRTLRFRIDGTQEAEQVFQEARMKAGTEPSRPDGFPPDPFPRESMLGAVCRFPESVQRHRPSEEESDPAMIVHVENDLRERIARLFARWMPNQTEDFAGRVQRRSSVAPGTETCNEGLICLLLHKEKQIRTDFAWFTPSSSVDTTALVNQMRDLTLPDNSEENPYLYAPLNILRRIFPETALPNRISPLP